jgi:uncharacterized protein (UPF0332 family)
MSLKQWADNSWLRPHQTSPEEIENLIKIVDRDLSDAAKGVSSDWRFGIAYNAALKLCTILLYASGYRAEKSLQHYRTIQAMPLILGEERKDDAEYLEACHKKRNIVEYEYVGGTTEDEADELIGFVNSLRDDVMRWLKVNYPHPVSF